MVQLRVKGSAFQVSRHLSCGSGFPAATIKAESLSQCFIKPNELNKPYKPRSPFNSSFSSSMNAVASGERLRRRWVVR